MIDVWWGLMTDGGDYYYVLPNARFIFSLCSKSLGMYNGQKILLSFLNKQCMNAIVIKALTCYNVLLQLILQQGFFTELIIAIKSFWTWELILIGKEQSVMTFLNTYLSRLV